MKRMAALLKISRGRLRDLGRHLLARLHRLRLIRTTFVGITGSAGKTTTKTLSAEILSALGACRSSPGSGNEHYDVEWTILKTAYSHKFGVVEVGAPRPGYLDRSLLVLRPQIGVLTLIEREHFSAFLSKEAIAAEKAKLIAALPRDGVAVLNIDDPLIRSIGENHGGRIIWVGSDEAATIRLLASSSIWPDHLTLRVRFEGNEYEISTRLHGTHLALPVLAALGVAVAARMRFVDAVRALSRIEPPQGRMQVESCEDGVTFIRDDYKAPEWSLEAPLAFLRDARSVRKVVVIGTLSDSLREDARRYARAARLSLDVADIVVLVGTQILSTSRARAIRDDGSLQVFRSVRDAATFLRRTLRTGDLVLLKGVNLQDHLVRLVLDRRRSVLCWEPACGRSEFCGSCPQLYAPRSSLVTTTEASMDRLRSAWRGRALPLIVGLGNPGPEFRGTRHNVGHRMLDALAEGAGVHWEADPAGSVSSVSLDGRTVTLFKPGVNMNDSGTAIRRVLELAGGTADDSIIVLDDMDIPLGQIRVKRESGDAGHKGMRSIIAALGTDVIPRIRIGVRRNGETRRASELVLQGFSTDEEATLMLGLKQADAAIREMIRSKSSLAVD